MTKPFSVALLGFALAVASSCWAATPLAQFTGKSRILIISSPSATDPAFERQNRWLRAGAAGVRDRDLLVIRIVGNTVGAPQNVKLDSQTLREAAGLRPDRFGLALIGKDGSETLSRPKPIPMASLFETIDAMPMRREEMRRRKP